jgi:hypothetical protein
VNPQHESLDNFILIAIGEIVIIDFILAWVLIVLGIILITSFGQGLRDLIENSDNRLLRRPFL